MNVESLFNVQHFSSQEKPSQQLFNADARPHIIKESFDEIDPPPSLERFNVFYGKGINCVVKYTNPGYFADLWVSGELQRQAMARRTKTKTNVGDEKCDVKKITHCARLFSRVNVRRRVFRISLRRGRRRTCVASRREPTQAKALNSPRSSSRRRRRRRQRAIPRAPIPVFTRVAIAIFRRWKTANIALSASRAV